MTVIIPEGVLTLGNEAVQWVPAIASPGIAAVTVAECTAGKPTQCVIKAFNPKVEQGATQDVRHCTTTKLETAGLKSYSIDPIEVIHDPQTPTSATDYALYTAWKSQPSGFLVVRRGIAHGAAFAVAQIVDVYPVRVQFLGRVGAEGGSDGDKFRSTFKLYVTGEPVFDRALS